VKKKWAIFTLLFVVICIATSFPVPKKASAAFSANNLISDSVFDFAYSMNAAQIDEFLNTFSNSCIRSASGFEAKIPNGYTPSGGFTYGGFGTAGQVIETAGRVYGINPQVLIVTLEKEQSLITGRNNFSGYCNNGDEHKYAAAVGYGCPDSGTTYNYSNVSLYRRNGAEHTNTGTTCVNSVSKAGFSQQVIRAAWLLKFGQQRSKGNTSWSVVQGSWVNTDDPATCYGGPMTQGNFKRCSNDSSATFYDGLITIDSLSTHMDTGGTAALYWYTPHFHGNQVFVALFEQYFSNTQVPSSCTGLESQSSTVMRFYNPRTFEHFYSAYTCDISFLQRIGFIYEGSIFNTTDCSYSFAQPIYRYFNPQTGLHMWTTDNVSQAQLDADKTGYKVEAGRVYCVIQPGLSGVSTHEVVRFYNPKTYLHFWTSVPNMTDFNILIGPAGYTVPEYPPIAFYTQ
jgi:hypothetical protein